VLSAVVGITVVALGVYAVASLAGVLARRREGPADTDADRTGDPAHLAATDRAGAGTRA
jgi:hypothetical protein